MVVGGILVKEQVEPVTVEWRWHDESKGLVKWTFTNPSSAVQSGLLFRATYPFGNAFWPIYEDNAAFNTSFTLINTPLPEQGVQSNSPPLAVFKNPDGSMFVAFLFTIAPQSSWAMLEGGFTSGMTPDFRGTPKFVPVTKQGINKFSILWMPTQCQDYNEQSGSDLPCPPNPISVSSGLFLTSEDIIPLFADMISIAGQPDPDCAGKIIQGILADNAGQVIAGLECGFGKLTNDIKKLIKEKIN